MSRLPAPADYSILGDIPGMPGVRSWGDVSSPMTSSRVAEIRRQIQSDPLYQPEAPVQILALSGGGQNGAFGAGLLAGWTASGTRPRFRMVTGVSTGALIAPFAFLGPDYDSALKDMYSRFSTRDVLRLRFIRGLFTADSMTDNLPLRKILMSSFTPLEMEKTAQEYRKGRRLFVATTWLDVQRPVIWNIGAIADSGHPGAYELIIDVLLASAAIPGVFPAGYFEVEQSGVSYDELHVDGGVTMQVFISPEPFNIKQAIRECGLSEHVNVYLIRNGKTAPTIESIVPQTIPILSQSISTMIRAQNNGDMMRIYQKAKLGHMEFHAAYIPDGFRKESAEPFDIGYMTKLYNLAYELSANADPWVETPPHQPDTIITGSVAPAYSNP